VFEPLPRWGDVVTSEAVPVRPSHLRQRTTGLVPGPSTVPALYETTVRHVRTAPFRNTFSYASSMWLVDVDDTDLPSLARPLRALPRFKARDHLGDPRRSLRQNIEHYLAGNGIDLAGGRVLLLTSPRSLGHAFNSLSVWWCHHARCCPHPLAGGPPLGAPPASSTVPAAVRKQVCSDRTHRALAGQPGPHSPRTAPNDRGAVHGAIPIDPQHWPDVAAQPAAGLRARMAKSLFRRIAGRLDVRVEPAAGLATPAVVWGAGGADAPVLRLVRPDAFFARVGQGGLIGFGESYMAGDWAADDLAGVLTVFAAQMAKLVPPRLQRLRDLYVQRHPATSAARSTTPRATSRGTTTCRTSCSSCSSTPR